MDIEFARRDLKLKRPFAISAGVSDVVTVVRVRIMEGRLVGVGEASPSLRVTGETVGTVEDLLADMRRRLLSDHTALEAGLDQIHSTVSSNGAARAALDTAVRDFVGRRDALPAYKMLRLRPARLATSKTVSLGKPAEMAEEARSILVEGFDVLKVKLGSPKGDGERLAAVRAVAPKARIRVDANCGWDLKTARRMLDALENNRVELLEQPVAPHMVRELGEITGATKIPVFADESVKTLEDVELLASTRTVRGINVKLMKSGGLGLARDLLALARKRKLKTMIGCMIESSVGISAAAQLLSLADYADLDGAALVANDDYDGARIESGVITTPKGPGIGAVPV